MADKDNTSEKGGTKAPKPGAKKPVAKQAAAPTGKAKPIQKAKAGVKRKRWVLVVAPKMFNEQPIGESLLSDPDEAIGRSFDASMMIITGEPQRQHIRLKFKITGRQGEKLMTEFIGFKINPSAMKKMMRRGKDRITDSFDVMTSDGKRIRLKPILATRGKAKGGALTSIRKGIRRLLPTIAIKMTSEQLFREIFEKKLQRFISDNFRKIYPLSTVDIRQAYIVEGEPKTGQLLHPSAEAKKEMPKPPATEKPAEPVAQAA